MSQKNSQADFQKEHVQLKKHLEQVIAQDFTKIQNVAKLGLINSGQEQNLKKEVLKKAFDKLVQVEKIKRGLQPALDKQNMQEANPLKINKSRVFDEFEKSNPNFFDSDGRKEVLDYLKTDKVFLGQDELSKISEIIKVVEKSAIERYLKKVSHEKTLRESNEAAKQKLTANAQRTGLAIRIF